MPAGEAERVQAPQRLRVGVQPLGARALRHPLAHEVHRRRLVQLAGRHAAVVAHHGGARGELARAVDAGERQRGPARERRVVVEEREEARARRRSRPRSRRRRSARRGTRRRRAPSRAPTRPARSARARPPARRAPRRACAGRPGRRRACRRCRGTGGCGCRRARARARSRGRRPARSRRRRARAPRRRRRPRRRSRRARPPRSRGRAGSSVRIDAPRIARSAGGMGAQPRVSTPAGSTCRSSASRAGSRDPQVGVERGSRTAATSPSGRRTSALDRDRLAGSHRPGSDATPTPPSRSMYSHAAGSRGAREADRVVFVTSAPISTSSRRARARRRPVQQCRAALAAGLRQRLDLGDRRPCATCRASASPRRADRHHRVADQLASRSASSAKPPCRRSRRRARAWPARRSRRRRRARAPRLRPPGGAGAAPARAARAGRAPRRPRA